ncbi:MAG TPA: methylmalonyl-CoA epimerase [Syntrophales bacterium]|nr:methylmalonyl-CoA epimerase [Syntrophobacterales bacterium]HNS55136.1 methylmalonyl-CoA epimerase [Syntrophales bacterium]HQL89140.1 methylmalonyl-CoA epimerase [Syntrophales bacterium]
MKITRLDHIGIAVKSIAESLKVYEAMGLKSVGVEEVAEQKVRVAFLPIGETEIELLESTAPDGPVAKYIEKNGEGIQHLALRVDNLEAALAEMKAKGVRLIDEKPRYGAGGAKIAFVHPRSTGGVLLELSERD